MYNCDMGNLEGWFVYRGLQGTANEDSGNEAFVCKWAVQGPGGRGALLDTLEGM